MSSIFTELHIKAGLQQKRRLSAFIDGLVQQHRPTIKKVRLQYIFCNDEYLHQMNLRYLNHDTLTDIITFDLSTDDKLLTGEMYISTERVKENATVFNVTYQHELHRVIFHGALHLCGFKDKTPDDEQMMREQENRALEQYFATEA